MWTGIPVIRISAEESERLLHMEDALHASVIGQEEAIQTISRAVRRARAGPEGPEAADRLVHLHGADRNREDAARARRSPSSCSASEDALIKIDMSEFMERHNVSRLVGAPPGYVGYDEGGQLTEAVRRKSYSVIVLDEIEKAHPEVFNILLQILEDGHLTDAKGRARRLPQHRDHHDQQRRRAAAPEGHLDRLPRRRLRGRPGGRGLRQDEGEGARRAEEHLPPRVPQPHRRDGRLPQPHAGGDPPDRGPAPGAGEGRSWQARRWSSS